MFVRPIKALFYSIALITLLATTASQQVQAVGLTRQPTTTGDKVHLAAAALSGPVSMAAIAYPDSRLLGCAEHVLKTIDEFMAMAQYREFHPSLIGWFCYDVYHAFASLQGPAAPPTIDADITDQLAALEADDTEVKNPITLSDGQRSGVKQFIRYVLAGVEATTRWMAALSNEQTESPAHKTYLWNSRGLLHSLSSLARLTNYYLETKNDDHKAVLLVLIIINAVGSGAYFVGSQKASETYRNEEHTQHGIPLQAPAAAAAAAIHEAATASTTTAATHTTDTDRTALNATPSLGIAAAGQNVLATTMAMPNAAAAINLDPVRANRPLGGKTPALNQNDFTTTLRAYYQQNNYRGDWNDAQIFEILFNGFCHSEGIEPFFPVNNDSIQVGKDLAKFRQHWRTTPLTPQATPQELDRFCQSFQTFCTREATLLDRLHTHRPYHEYGSEIFDHDDFKGALQLCYQQNHNRDWGYRAADFMYPFNDFCQQSGIQPFFSSEHDMEMHRGNRQYFGSTGTDAENSMDTHTEWLTEYWGNNQLRNNASPQDIEHFCQGFQNFCNGKVQDVIAFARRVATEKAATPATKTAQ